MAPEGRTLEESNRNLDEITDLALELQKQTGVKVLWVTCNLFAHPRSVTLTVKAVRTLIYSGSESRVSVYVVIMISNLTFGPFCIQ